MGRKPKFSQSLIDATISVATAVLTGKHVSQERIEARVLVCSKCNKATRKTGKKGDVRLTCGICGCRVGKHRAIMNLAKYEENPGKRGWGCKHPKGSQWKAAGV